MKGGFEYLERGAGEGQAQSLIILLHGYGRDARLMDKQGAVLEALIPGARILMPHGPEPARLSPDDHDAPASPRQWFAIRGASIEDRVDVRAGLRTTVGQMNKFIDVQRDRNGLGDSQIALMGFSQGGTLALYTAFMRARALSCVVGHSILFPEAPAPRATPPTLYLYGTQDEEFSQATYREGSARLVACCPDVKINVIAGLSHRTSDLSRRHVAHYIKKQLARL